MTANRKSLCIICGKKVDGLEEKWCEGCFEFSVAAAEAIMRAQKLEDVVAVWGAFLTQPTSETIGATNCTGCGAILFVPYPFDGGQDCFCPTCATGKNVVKDTEGYDPAFWRMPIGTFRKLNHYRQAKKMGSWAEMMTKIAETLSP